MAKKIKLLYVITDSGVGGSEKVLLSLLQRLDRSLVELVGVIIIKNKREMASAWEACGVPVYSFGFRYPNPFLFLKIHALIKQINPDVVHAFLYHATQISRMSHWLYPNSKLITSPRVNYRVLPLWARLIDRCLHATDDRVLCESTATKDYLVSSAGYDEKKTVVVTNGVDAQHYQFNAAQRQTWRKKWNVADHQLLIGAVGRLHMQKGFDVLLSALSTVKGAVLVIVGEGPEYESLKKQARDLNLAVMFPGRLDALSEIYSAFDIYVQSSRYEGMSNALLEAMSVGLPIVATDVDGTLDVAHDQQNMLLVKPGKASLLSQALNSLIVNPDLRKKIAEAARQTALTNSINNMIKKFEEVYRLCQ